MKHSTVTIGLKNGSRAMKGKTMTDAEKEFFPQREWIVHLAESGLSLPYLCSENNLSIRQVRKWVNCEIEPRTKSLAAMQKVIKMAKGTKKIDFHPSYGYETPEQIEKLNSLGVCPERTRILEQIRFQNENGGRVK